MRSSRLTNTLLAFACLLLALNLVRPLFTPPSAVALDHDEEFKPSVTVGEDEYESPAVAAAQAGIPALDNAAGQVKSGLKEIAKSNDRIADAIKELAASNRLVADSVQEIAGSQ
jgi:hypothetical protein